MEKKKDVISIYIEDREFTANTFVLRCFSVTILIFSICYLLNILNVFIVDQEIMRRGFFSCLLIYIVVIIASKKISLSDERVKYVFLFAITLVYTIMGLSLTYHVVLVSVLPFLYAALYSSKRIINYVYVLAVISTVVVVYGGYFWGLCDANMALLTTKRLTDYVVNGQFTLTQVNENPYVSLLLFYVVPRCLIYIAFASVFSNIYNIVSGSLERAKLSTEFQKEKEAAENANRAKTNFLARMSHEIRTPINAVLGMNEMILSESKEEDIQNYAMDIKRSAEALMNIINEILDSSKIESGKMEIVPVNYKMGSLINDLYNMTKFKAEEKNLKLFFDVSSNLPSECYGDDMRLRQVLLNLLTNAVKYTYQGSVVLKITESVSADSVVLHCSVADTGTGIRQEDIDNLFDPFKRVNMSQNRNVEGTGLGLSIVSQLLVLMGSELKVKSEYGKGSEFFFDIEQRIVDAKPMGDFAKKINKTEEDVAKRIEFTAPNAKVLVVDDSTMNLKVFKYLLKKTKIQVYEAESGREAIELIKKDSFHIVFLDHMMPEMDGIEVLQYIRDENLCVNTPIIMLTANAIVGEKEKYIAYGFDDFLSKPVIPEELDSMIIKYLPSILVSCQPDSGEKLDMKVGINNAGGEELYYSLLGDFYLLIDMKSAKIERCLREKDISDYTVEVHALKNISRLIGAVKLGDEFAELEQLGKAEDYEQLKAKTDGVIQHFQEYKALLADYEENAEEAKEEADRQDITELLHNMEAAVDKLDTDKLETTIKRIDNYRFPASCRQDMKELRVLVGKLEWEGIKELCERLEDKLRKG